MSDYDRGAYAPPADGPLSFDARPSRQRRPAPVSLIVGLVVLAVLGGGLVLMYRGGVRTGGGAPPTVGQPVGAIRTAPDAASQPRDGALQLDVLNERQPAPPSTTTAEPTFAPAPEEPLARSAAQPAAATPAIAPALAPQPPEEASAPVAAVAPTPASTPAAAAPAPVVRAPTASTPVAQTPAIRPATPPAPRAAAPIRPAPLRAAPAPVAATARRAPVVAPAVASIATPRATPRTIDQALAADATPRSARPTVSLARADRAVATVRTAPATAPARATPATTPAARSGPVSVQIGAFASDATARSQLASAGRGGGVTPVTTASGTVYRATVRGFASREEAQAWCARRGGGCIIR